VVYWARSKEIIQKLIWIAVGQFIGAIAFSRILLVNNLVATGLGGLATVINHYTGLSIQLLLVFLAIPIFIWAFFRYDKEQIFYAAFSFFVFTFYLGFVGKCIPAFKTDPIIAAVAGGVLLGISVGIIMRQRVANGPEAIIGLYFRDKKGMTIGTFFLVLNSCIIGSSILYGSLTLIIYSFVSNFIQSAVTDNVIVGSERYYIVNVMSDSFINITEYIRNELHRGVIFVQGMDTANVKKKMLIQTVINKNELISLKDYIRSLHDDSFVYATQSAALLGRGFNVDQ
jgi:uncharacterized membrane-anchored protein YitT (DUF2179 family)